MFTQYKKVVPGLWCQNFDTHGEKEITNRKARHNDIDSKIEMDRIFVTNSPDGEPIIASTP